MKFKAWKIKGKIEINWHHLETYTQKWKDGTVFEIEIRRPVKKKSDPLRKYYWSTVLPPFLEHLGYDRDEDELFHKQLKIVYFRIQPDKKGIYRDKLIPSVFSNESDIIVPEKQKFVDWVIRKAAQEGVYIPNPNE